MLNHMIGGLGEPAYDIESSIICQRNYCERNALPHFAPFDGICWCCHKNIYSPVAVRNPITGEYTYTGIPTYRAGCQLITGCPHCNYSFCN